MLQLIFPAHELEILCSLNIWLGILWHSTTSSMSWINRSIIIIKRCYKCNFSFIENFAVWKLSVLNKHDKKTHFCFLSIKCMNIKYYLFTLSTYLGIHQYTDASDYYHRIITTIHVYYPIPWDKSEIGTLHSILTS